MDQSKRTRTQPPDSKEREGEEEGPLHLRFVGFCGVDETFDFLSSDFKWPSYIEWGVLFRPEKEGERRFPTKRWIEAFVKDKEHLAAHLCSIRCSEFLLEGKLDFVRELIALGFRRFQINATKANNFDSSLLSPRAAQVIIDAAQMCKEVEFIVQRNEETGIIWRTLESMDADKVPSNISYLFDSSVGRGVVVSSFGKPAHASAKYGYAGGLKPENVESVLRQIAKNVSSGVRVWIDMESGIRQPGSDDFDAERAWRVCEAIDKLVKEGVIVFTSE